MANPFIGTGYDFFKNTPVEGKHFDSKAFIEILDDINLLLDQQAGGVEAKPPGQDGILLGECQISIRCCNEVFVGGTNVRG